MGKHVRTISQSYLWGVDFLMIFVILGTQDKVFPRLLEAIQHQIDLGNIKEKVIVQAGSTNFESKDMEIFDYISMDNFEKYIEKSDYIITHGGVGTILDGLKKNKKIITIPRLKEYGEHENDHQLQIIAEFVKLGYVLTCDDLSDLDQTIKNLNSFTPNKYQSNNNNFVNLVRSYIDKW